MVLFSGGVDSTLLATLLHEVTPIQVPIDLCNVSFDGENAPDRISISFSCSDQQLTGFYVDSIQALYELRQWAPGRQWNLICVDSSLNAVQSFK